MLWPVSVSTTKLISQGIGFRETLKNPTNLFKNNLNKTRNDMKSQIQKKKKKTGRIVELLIPTFFQKKLLMRGQTFLGKKLWGGCSKLDN